MTVAELIIMLQSLPQDAVVLKRDGFYSDTYQRGHTFYVRTLVEPFWDDGKFVTDPNDRDGLVRGKFIYL